MRIEEVLAKNLKEIRKKRGMTQEDVAARVDMQPNYYATCERAEKVMSLDMLAKIAKVFRVPPHVLLMPNGVDHVA